MSNRQTLCDLLVALAVLFLPNVSHAADESSRVLMSSDMAAAFLVAYNDYVQATAGDPTPMTVNEFRKHFAGLSLERRGGTAIVVFTPPPCEYCTGGGAFYVVNLKTLAISERLFGR